MLDVERLKELMDEKGIQNVRELSDVTGIPCTTIYYMMNGHDAYVSTLLQLAKFFNVPIDYLVRKYFGIVTVTKKGIIYTPTTNIFEATLSTMDVMPLQI